MAELSPAAQAVLDAVYSELDYAPQRHVRWCAAAALRALTKTSLVEEALSCGWFCSAIRTEDILDIAAELENQ